MQYSNRAPRLSLPRRWPLLVLGVGLVAGGTVCAFRVQTLAREKVPAYLHAHLEAALGRPVEWSALRVFPTGVMLEGFRVPKRAGEAADPVSTRRVHASVNWWELLARRKVHISGLDVDGLRLRLAGTPAGKAKTPWTRQLLGLSRTGVDRFRLRDASVETAAAPGSAAWAVHGVTGDLVVQPASFRCSGRAAAFQRAGVELGEIRLAATGDASRLKISSGRVAYQGAQLHGSGCVNVAANTAGLTLHVKDLPLDRLGQRLGLPRAWTVRGQVTGDVTVDAGNNALRRVAGTVRVARGSVTRDGGKLPWTSASARVLWTPQETRVSELVASGAGVTLSGGGQVLTPAALALTRGTFRFGGRLTAEGTAAVARVSELLAFQRLLNGRCEAGRASVDFSAGGAVAQLAQAHARGTLHVEALRVLPVAGSVPVVVTRLDAALERFPDRLVVRNVQAQTAGLALHGDATLTNDHPGHPGLLSATGGLDIRDLHSLRVAFPQANLWEWLPADSPHAAGRVRFALEGEVAHLAGVRTHGTFELRDFRLASHAPLPGGLVLHVPVQSAAGAFHYAGRRFELSDLSLASPEFGATGQLAVDLQPASPLLSAHLRLHTENWRALPGMPAHAIPELQGGRFEGELHASGDYAHLASLPVEGSFSLKEATYTPGRPGATALDVDEFAARFRWADHALAIPFLSITTPLLQARAHGRLYPHEQQYRLALDVETHSDHAGQLINRFLSERRLASGVLTSSLHLDAPVERLQDADLNGSVGIRGIRTRQAVAQLGSEPITANEVALEFSRSGDRWEASRLLLDAPSLHVEGKGSLAGTTLAADLHARVGAWVAPASLPFEGGALAADGQLSGDVREFSALAFSGNLGVEGARLRYASPRVSLQDGALRLAAHGTGRLSDPLAWLQGGDVHLAGALARVEGRAPLTVDTLTGSFTRQGDGFRWSDARLAVAGNSAVSSGRWSPAGYEAHAEAVLPHLDRLGVALPKGVAFAHGKVGVTVSGTPEQPFQKADGHAEVEGIRVAWGEAPEQSFPHAAADFHFDPTGGRLERFTAAGPAGRLEGSGDWTRDAYQARFSVAGDDVARLGFHLPQGFAAGRFGVEGEASGGRNRQLAARGTVRVEGLRVPFGPEGPHAAGLATARFDLREKHAALTEIAVEGPSGKLTGAGEAGPDGYHVALASPGLDPKVARWLLPGKVEGGKLAGTLEVSGSSTALARVQGRFELTDARYTLPTKLALLGGATPVSRLAGDYRWEPGHVGLDHLLLECALGHGAGALRYADGQGTLTADLASSDLGRIGDFWPALVGKMHGGTATGRLDSRFTAEGMTGTLALRNQGGTLGFPGFASELAQNPVDSASANLAFAPGKLTFRDVQVRGPRGNANGEGEWNAEGPVWGKGTAWYSKEYTARLIKPTGFRWLARLAGVKQIKTDFTLSGTAERVNLNAAITKGMLWRLAKGHVPKEVQLIATGKSPLWERPLEVADAGAAE